MKLTIVFTTLLCVSTSWAKKVEDLKDKREAAVSYASPHAYQGPVSFSQGDANSISVGAGYSIGGQSKPRYGFSGHIPSNSLQLPADGSSQQGHSTIQLTPITLQSGQISGTDLSQIMSQLTQSLNSGALSLQPSNAVAEFHQSVTPSQGIHQGQLLSPQLTYLTPKYELSQQLSNAPPYSSGAKGLSSYTSTGPVLFTPNDQQPAAPASTFSYSSAGSGHPLGVTSGYSSGSAGQALGGSGQSFGGSAHSFGTAGQSLGSSGNYLGGAGNSFGSSGHLLSSSAHGLSGSGPGNYLGSQFLGGSGQTTVGFSHPVGNTFGGAYKQISGSYSTPTKTSFRPSTFLGSSDQGESYAAPAFGSYRGGLAIGASSHGGVSYGNPLHGYGSSYSKFITPVYQSSKAESFDGSSGLLNHYASPPGSSFGTSSSSYSNSAQAASSNRPFYVKSKYRGGSSSFGQNSTPHRASISSPSASYTPERKYGFGALYEDGDAHGSASENSYNTIKYSEELKPLN